jgi:hypothetical protein
MTIFPYGFGIQQLEVMLKKWINNYNERERNMMINLVKLMLCIYQIVMCKYKYRKWKYEFYKSVKYKRVNVFISNRMDVV